MSPVDAAIQTGIQAGSGALLTTPHKKLIGEEFPVGSRWRNPTWKGDGELAEVVSNHRGKIVLERAGQQLETTPEALRQSIRNGVFAPAESPKQPEIEDLFDEPQVQTKSPVAAELAEVESRPTP